MISVTIHHCELTGFSAATGIINGVRCSGIGRWAEDAFRDFMSSYDAERPCISLDELNQYLNQYNNSLRQNKDSCT